jgi:hypothetical protein
LAPGGPVKTAQQQAVFTAGEIAALLAGRRGVAIVQLFNGWDRDKGQVGAANERPLCCSQRLSW